MKVTLFEFEHRGDGTYFSGYIPAKLDLRGLGNLTTGDLLLNDCRMISRQQQKKIYAMIGDISDYTGHHVEFLKSYLKCEYIKMYGGEWFSLGYVDMTTARKFIEFILHICFEWEVPLKLNTVDLTRDVNNYLYLCLKYRKCAVCGCHADIHHHENLVGMGMDRAKHNHIDSRFIALCRVHHNECHNIGHKTFEDKYKITAIKLNESAIKELGI
ncbi:putative HNHc nuclease [Turicibacter sanguinis]|uniref:putative HNHc nuclease n=1 Tax=Turicibacter sanguinis TaxID=154288 RepID=UPI0021D51317|nr:putative HNHc nuclease [Turicibacter sanguinis]MCU7192285.1 putative HNHc nuclease [Turicibacter sanguinis]